MHPKSLVPAGHALASNIDPRARSVLELADGNRSAAEIALLLSMPKADVEDAFDQLRSAGLLSGWTAPPSATAVISRRRAVADLSKAAALFGAAIGAMAALGPSPAFAAPGRENQSKNKEEKNKEKAKGP